jgi:hypothetical protein
MNITTEQATANFEEISRQLMASAPTEKAAAFADKIIRGVRAKGAEWIAARAFDLQVNFVPGHEMFPVADNRTYYISRWQMALLK